MPRTALLQVKQARDQKFSWFWWLAPKPFDWLASPLYIGVFITFIALQQARGAAWQTVILSGALLLLLGIDRLEFWRYGEETPKRVAIRLLVTRMLLIETVALIEGFVFSPFLYIILPYLAVVYWGNIPGYAIAALVEVAYVAKITWYQPHWYLQRTNIFLVILFTFGVLFVVTMAQVVAREQVSRVRAERLLVEVERSHQQLQANAEQIAELATTEERNRVAREIHDSLGHALIAINVQLEKALVYYEQSPQEALQSITDAKRVAKEALQDVRGSVRALRTPGIFFCTQSITSLVHHLQHGSLTVDLSVGGSEDGFSRQDLLALYRVAQESLTNIQKHAQARHVQVELRFSEQEAYLSIHDNGRGFDPTLLQQVKTEHAGGYGLQGMRERVELVRGTLQVNSQVGQGTTVVVTIPNRRGTPSSREHGRLAQGARRT